MWVGGWGGLGGGLGKKCRIGKMKMVCDVMMEILCKCCALRSLVTKETHHFLKRSPNDDQSAWLLPNLYFVFNGHSYKDKRLQKFCYNSFTPVVTRGSIICQWGPFPLFRQRFQQRKTACMGATFYVYRCHNVLTRIYKFDEP